MKRHHISLVCAFASGLVTLCAILLACGDDPSARPRQLETVPASDEPVVEQVDQVDECHSEPSYVDCWCRDDKKRKDQEEEE